LNRNPESEFNPIHEIQFEQVLGRSVGFPDPVGEFPMQNQSENVQQVYHKSAFLFSIP